MLAARLTSGGIFTPCGPVIGGQDSPNLGPTKGVSFKGNLIWNPTDLLTVTSKIRREVRETTIPGASSAFTSTFELGVDYDMFDNFILSTVGKYNIETFDAIDQTDTLTTLELNAKYFIGPNYLAKARYQYEERVTDAAGGGFTGNSFMVSFVVQL
ncbi:MAG: outer membrane beta-barrel protein [Alphaproteobacteria bacterium]